MQFETALLILTILLPFMAVVGFVTTLVRVLYNRRRDRDYIAGLRSEISRLAAQVERLEKQP